MTELLFYHLEHRPLEGVLPQLLEKSLERGWRAAVQASSEERVEALDALLWTYRDDGFLPHGTFRESMAAEQPILLTVSDDNPNRAMVRFLIDRAPFPDDAEGYSRIVVLFNGDDEEAVAEARDLWRSAKSRGFAVTYWQCDERGRWQQRG